MNNLLNFLIVGFGGALGAMLRYGLTLLLTGQPIFATMMANVAGSFLIGLAIGSVHGRLLLFLTVGLCGGFTTFSTFSSQILYFLQSGNYLSAIFYATASVILCVVAAYVGFKI